MAELQFDYDLPVEQAFINTCISNEPNNSIVQYGLKEMRQINDFSNVLNSNYTALQWANQPALLSSQALRKIGIKSFPQIGAIAFYTLQYEPRSVILAPVFTESNLYVALNMEITQQTETITFNIVEAGSASYDCYRVIMRNGYFATEYVSYERLFVVPKPVSGTYTIYLMGYIEDRLASETQTYANVIIVNSTPTPTPLGDTVYSVNNQVADINGNVMVSSQHIPFTADDFEAENVRDALIELSEGSASFIVTLLADNWVANEQTILAPGVALDNIIFIAPTPEDQPAYVFSNIICTAQGPDSLTFICATAPVANINVGVVIL